jgi:hypothetical protein
MDCYEDIRANGYKTQEELRKANRSCARGLDNELRVAINRDGEAVFVGLQASHRFSMLRLLGITKAPAVLIGVSDLWAKKEIALTGFGKRSLVRHIHTKARETLASACDERPTARNSRGVVL